MRIGEHLISKRSLVLFFSAIAVLFNLYNLAWLPPDPYIQRGILVSVFIILSVLLNTPKSKPGMFYLSIFMLAALAGSVYMVIFADKLNAQMNVASEAEIYMFIVFLVGFSVILTRIPGGGVVITILLFIGLAYLLWGQHIPGLFGHTPLPMHFIATMLYSDVNVGAFGFYTDIMLRVVSIFMVFAALLMATGLDELFTSIACRVAGEATGGPAKVSIFSSAAFGMISGSSVANVAATGSFTIPLMKSVGYSPGAAASVEAIASTGGNLMPPIMGIAAFLMAEILGIPYLRICIAAIIPVFLWYFTIFITVHYYALRTGIKKWRPPKEEFVRVIKGRIHLVLSIFALVGALLYFASAEQGAFWAVIFLIILSSFKKDTRLNKAKIAKFLEQYAQMFAPLLVIVVGVSMFVSAILGVWAHVKIGTLMLGGIQDWYLLTLIAAAFIIILGTALPLTASYLAGVTILAPILIQAGYQPLIVHFFVFYVATMAPITPPIGVATFTAARIAGSNMMKTGLEAAIRALPLWIVPFAMFKKGLIFGLGTPLSTIAIEVILLCFGIFIFVIGVEGYFTHKLRILERGLAMAIGLMIVQPLSDLLTWVFTGVGILLLIAWWLPNFFQNMSAKRAQAG